MHRDAHNLSAFPPVLGAFNQYFWIRELVSSNAMLFWAQLRGEVNEGIYVMPLRQSRQSILFSAQRS
jgi:hypothetical protein